MASNNIIDGALAWIGNKYKENELLGVKTVTITGTTNFGGAFDLSSVVKYLNGEVILTVATNTNANAMCIPWVYNNNAWYVSVLNWSNLTLMTSTQLTFTVKYIPASN